MTVKMVVRPITNECLSIQLQLSLLPTIKHRSVAYIRTEMYEGHSISSRTTVIKIQQ